MKKEIEKRSLPRDSICNGLGGIADLFGVILGNSGHARDNADQLASLLGQLFTCLTVLLLGSTLAQVALRGFDCRKGFVASTKSEHTSPQLHHRISKIVVKICERERERERKREITNLGHKLSD